VFDKFIYRKYNNIALDITCHEIGTLEPFLFKEGIQLGYLIPLEAQIIIVGPNGIFCT